ncbi:arylsulfatase [Sphingopyxis italica]|uniref:Arylsulfatase n=1 Tax=Sphingopyxis italica TaxID=1129133 RepID=A0A7X5XNF6_9SPHN|nr:arylsulfatase [Sphingopyxis italica]NJB88299.1 arylsulfatase [Sphingopyxis italica]
MNIVKSVLRATATTATALALLAGPCALPATAQTPARPAALAAAQQAKRPNVIVILVDDMGFSDIGPYGSEIPTPNLDALAANGLRFTQFYNSARCSPSRASLLTGLYPHEAGMGGLDSIVRPGLGGFQGRLADRAVTIAEVLKPAGYFTGMAGKWHVGAQHGTPPKAVGFDRSMFQKGGTYFPDQPGKGRTFVTIDGRQARLDSPEVGKGEWYASDMLVDWTVRFVDEAKVAGKPFFLYLPFTAVHFPVMAPADEIAKFKGKYMAGWDQLRRDRFERQKKTGLIAADATLPDVLPEAYDWDKLPAADKERFDTIMAVYAAAISRMDKAIGTLVADLKARGEFDNTLILFMSDNGGNAESGPDGRTGAAPWGGKYSNIFVGLNWATLQNTPFRYFKHYAEEGGIATPLIASWPAGIDAKVRGTMVREPGHLVDVMPTLAELAGAKYPARFDGHDIRPMSGRSFAGAFDGKPLTRSVPIFWEHEGNKAVRDGKWKLVAQFGAPWQLYDMSTDRTETRDLAAAHPDIAARMTQQWNDWAAKSFVDPWPNKVDGGVIKGRLEGGKAPGKGKHGKGKRKRAAQAAAGA